MMQPYGRELCDIPYIVNFHTNSMSMGRDKLKKVYKIKPKEFSDDIEHHMFPAYVQLQRELKDYNTSAKINKLYMTKSKGHQTIEKIQSRMTYKMMNEIPNLGGIKTPRGSGYSRFNQIRDLITTKYFDLEEIEFE